MANKLHPESGPEKLRQRIFGPFFVFRAKSDQHGDAAPIIGLQHRV
jgi:hypothetical protein